MVYNDNNVTFEQLTGEVLKLCLAKGWGIDGKQNPQHVTAAMTVEMLELLEHFCDCDDNALSDESERTETLEEAADVMNYFVQAMYVLGFDAVNMIDPGFSADKTPILTVRKFVGRPETPLYAQAMKTAVASRFALEEFNWLDQQAVDRLFERRDPEKAERIGRAYSSLLIELLRLINMLEGDVASIVRRKLDIVYKRKYSPDEPKR